MKIAYFDCFSGISGDMTLGAIVANGLPIETLSAEIAKLGLSGYELKTQPVIKKGISATKVDVLIHEKQVFRHLPKIIEIIEKSTLTEIVKKNSIAVFQRLGEAEAKVHGIAIEKVHFHEVGALDAIIDIVGSCVGLHLLGVEKIHASRLNLGTGFVKSEHGVIPVPAPATVELCKGVPTYSTEIQKELVTPTGAALITTLATGFGAMPTLRLTSTGYGAGNAQLEGQANVLRIMIGESVETQETDTLTVIETNIDDMNPQVFDYLTERLLESGALDVYHTPVHMKKNRPAIVLTVLAKPSDSAKLTEIIFSETTTFGIRTYQTQRQILKREIIPVKTQYGEIRVKTGFLNGKILSATPEYEDCKKLAAQHKIPLKTVQQAALLELNKKR